MEESRARRRAAAAVFAALLAASGAVLAACLDLFHSTTDLRTACEIDAQTPGCAADASGPPRIDFCRDWSPSVARGHAQHACAWLGACESPTGRNAFGSCMFEALLAYDCRANPNHRVKGRTRDLWDCLWRVTSCSEVDACVFPGGVPVCQAAANVATCGDAAGAGMTDRDVRIECPGGGPPPSASKANGENCALWGQTCASGGAPPVCAGTGAPDCVQSGCFGNPRTELRWCADGGDVGLDCASNGAQECLGFPADASLASWIACAAESDAGACTPDASATCSNGVAFSCPAGVLEAIDCDALLQSEGGCTEGPLANHFDWTSPCLARGTPCTTDSCSPGGLLTGCARQAAFPLDCAAENLGPCHMVTVLAQTGPEPRAACSAR